MTYLSFRKVDSAVRLNALMCMVNLFALFVLPFVTVLGFVASIALNYKQVCYIVGKYKVTC